MLFLKIFEFCVECPLNIHGRIFLTSPYGSYKFTDPYNLATLTTYLRIVCYELSRITTLKFTNNVRDFYGFLRVYYGVLLFIEAFMF